MVFSIYNIISVISFLLVLIDTYCLDFVSSIYYDRVVFTMKLNL